MKKELLEKDGVSVKEEVDDDFFNDLQVFLIWYSAGKEWSR